MLLLLWKNFTTSGIKPHTRYYTTSDGGRSPGYSVQQERQSDIVYTADRRASRVEYRVNQEE